MTSEDSMLVNFTVSDDPPAAKQGAKLKKPAPRNRKDRLQMRRTEKRLKAKFSSIQTQEDKQSLIKSHSPGSATVTPNRVVSGAGVKRGPDETNEASTGIAPPKRLKTSNDANTPPARVISSLFNKNPEIPKLAKIDVIQKKETVFTKTNFAELPLHQHLISCLEEKMCLSEMTEVQRLTIPHALNGRDCLVKSQTGSGKTLSYAVPMVEKLRSRPTRINRADGVYALILVPTRELALQTLAVLKKLLQSCIWIVPGNVIGGESKKSEKARLRKGVNVLVATPGRIVDHINTTNCLSFSRLEFLIIDEADRLLDMGFEKDVSHILSTIDQVAKHRQTLLLSATLSTNVQRLAKIALTEPCTIDVAAPGQETSEDGQESSYTVPMSLKQYYVIAPSKLRLVALASFILDKCKQSTKRHKMIVFLPCQEVVQFYFTLLNATINDASAADSEPEEEEDEGAEPKTHFQMFALHGDMQQQYRSDVFTSFRAATAGVLLCTDVAARGLDLPLVDWIVQLAPPPSTEDYIHRVGRTARIGSKGSALIFVLPSEVKYLEELNRAKISLNPLELDAILHATLVDAGSLPSKAGKSGAPRTVQESATALQQALEEWTYAEPERLAQAKSAYQSFIRSYATYPSAMKYIFHIKNLHLGHVAKSFCLREAPSGFKGHAVPKDKTVKHSKMAKLERIRKLGAERRITMSEFASGL